MNSNQLIISYAKTWNLLLAYDEDRLALSEKGKAAISSLDYLAVRPSIVFCYQRPPIHRW